jgi:hypothetical protein
MYKFKISFLSYCTVETHGPLLTWNYFISTLKKQIVHSSLTFLTYLLIFADIFSICTNNIFYGNTIWQYLVGRTMAQCPF